MTEHVRHGEGPPDTGRPQSPPARAGGRSLWSDAWRRLMRSWGARISLAVIVLYALVAVGGVVYSFVAERHDDVPTFTEMADPDNANEPPSLESVGRLLGTDWNGRSVLVKTLLGVKVSMSVGLISNLIAVPLGLLLGVIAGYYGGWIDSVIVWLYTTLMSVPGIILLIALKYAFRDVEFWGLDLGGIYGIYVALGVISWIGTCRLVRAEVLKVRELDYCLAARSIGAPGFSILFRHVMPNVLHLAIINFSLGFVGAIKSEVILSYLGLGVEVGTPSWGSMINSARLDLFVGRWWELTSAVVAMFALVLALNIFGDRLRDALDPRLKNV